MQHPNYPDNKFGHTLLDVMPHSINGMFFSITVLWRRHCVLMSLSMILVSETMALRGLQHSKSSTYAVECVMKCEGEWQCR